VYPSNAADLKGLLKSAYYDPNPVVVFEHKGLYWSKVPGTEAAKTVEPDEHYRVPIGVGRVVLEAHSDRVEEGDSCVVVTYGMGVHWAMAAAEHPSLKGKVEVVDLRSLYPADERLCFEQARRHGKVLVLTEEPLLNSFAESLAHRISKQSFQSLDAPVDTLGAVPMPAVPLNEHLEQVMLPSVEQVRTRILSLLAE